MDKCNLDCFKLVKATVSEWKEFLDQQTVALTNRVIDHLMKNGYKCPYAISSSLDSVLLMFEDCKKIIIGGGQILHNFDHLEI